jgi:hypothetical protein
MNVTAASKYLEDIFITKKFYLIVCTDLADVA